jgi:hypothetical protein
VFWELRVGKEILQDEKFPNVRCSVKILQVGQKKILYVLVVVKADKFILREVKTTQCICVLQICARYPVCSYRVRKVDPVLSKRAETLIGISGICRSGEIHQVLQLFWHVMLYAFPIHQNVCVSRAD